MNSNVEVENCTFVNNTAMSGGAISVECNYLIPCTNVIRDSVFTNNVAIEEGGGIIYNTYQPELINNTYGDNIAELGNDVASYATRIKKVSNGTLVDLNELNDVPSGIVIDEDMVFAVVSAEQNSIMTSNSRSVIKWETIDENTRVRGQNTVTLNKGMVTFSDTIFEAAPGMQDVKFRLASSAIDYNVLQYLDPVKYADQIISVNFRWCKPGEIQDGNTCLKCNSGSYSVTWNSTQCLTCPENASCEEERISLSAGYWRISRNSTDIMECPNEEACLGGYNATSKYPVN